MFVATENFLVFNLMKITLLMVTFVVITKTKATILTRSTRILFYTLGVPSNETDSIVEPDSTTPTILQSPDFTEFTTGLGFI